MVPNMSSGIAHVSARDEKGSVEDPEDTHVVQDDRQTDSPPQLEHSKNILDDSEPEYRLVMLFF